MVIVSLRSARSTKKEEKIIKICITGHRPNKLWGYDLNNEKYIKLIEVFKYMLVSMECTEAITGMALGVDTVFAKAVLSLKEEGHDIKLICAIPCQNHSSNWPKSSQDEYEDILSKADEVIIVSDAPFTARLMQIRNVWMADRCDLAFAVWDRTSGGTKNCIDYLKKIGKKIYIINPGQL